MNELALLGKITKAVPSDLPNAWLLNVKVALRSAARVERCRQTRQADFSVSEHFGRCAPYARELRGLKSLPPLDCRQAANSD
jgi:hypothetical protein